MTKNNETIKERLVRIEERMITMNKNLEELRNIVNHEQESYNKRLQVVEKFCIEDKAKYKGRMELYKWVSVGLGLLVAGLTVAKLLGVF